MRVPYITFVGDEPPVLQIAGHSEREGPEVQVIQRFLVMKICVTEAVKYAKPKKFVFVPCLMDVF